MLSGWSIAIVAVIGLLVGSFLNEVIHRIYESDESLLAPLRCPQCQHRRGFFDAIPVLSYLWLRGCCRYCKAKIPIQYPIIELLTAFLFVGAYWLHGPTLLVLRDWIAITFILPIMIGDWRHMQINVGLCVLGAVAAIAIASALPGHSSLNALIGLLVYGGTFFLIRVVASWYYKQEALGEGDVWFALTVGAFVGFSEYLVFTFTVTSVLAGLVHGLICLVSKQQYLPFGTYMGAATLLMIFFVV